MSPASRRCLHCRPIVARTFVANFGHVPDLFEDLDTKALVVGVVAGKMAVVLPLSIGARTPKDEFFPVTHLETYGGCLLRSPVSLKPIQEEGVSAGWVFSGLPRRF